MLEKVMPAQEQRTVLYIEDEPAVQRLVRFWLEDAGYRVLTAEDGRAGLAAMRLDRPDLVVTDALMPEIMGDDVVLAMKTDLTNSRRIVVRNVKNPSRVR
jgi:two-component system alkaline phosphatase synthesis response regulator PhoP